MVQLTGADFLEIEDDVDLDGFDIIFKAEDDATCGGAGLAPCILDHEIEEYDETTDNRLVAWVRIPVLDFDNNTTIYLYYGNAAVTAATQNPTGVWDSNYVGVWHLKEDPTGGAPQHLDSTSNDNDGTAQAMESADSVDGNMDKALNFDPSSEYVQIPNSASLDITGNAITLSAWVKADAAPDDDNGFLTKYIGGNYNYMISASASDRSNFRVRTGGDATRIDTTTALPIGSWA